jgi:hypothetical protein
MSILPYFTQSTRIMQKTHVFWDVSLFSWEHCCLTQNNARAVLHYEANWQATDRLRAAPWTLACATGLATIIDEPLAVQSQAPRSDCHLPSGILCYTTQQTNKIETDRKHFFKGEKLQIFYVIKMTMESSYFWPKLAHILYKYRWDLYLYWMYPLLNAAAQNPW